MNLQMNLTACVAVALLIVTMAASTAFAAEGSIDWGKGVIRATGIGVGKVDKDKSPGLYRAQSKRAAMMDAQRNLAEIVRGVRVTSDSTIADMMLQSDVVRTRVDAIIKGMQEVSSQYYEEGMYEVVLEMPLFGAGNALSDAAFIPFKDEPKVPFMQPVDDKIVSQPAIVNANYSGLVIDCRGLNLQAVMSPVIKNDSGKKIYGHENLDIEKVIMQGMASYAEAISDEVIRARAGDNPLIVKAVSLSNFNAYPVVSAEDADKILAANQHDKFLNNCAVVFIR